LIAPGDAPPNGARQKPSWTSLGASLFLSRDNMKSNCLAHIIARIEDGTDPNNFMFKGNLPQERRARESMRRFWSARLTFNSDQIKRLVCAMHTGSFAGGLTSERRVRLPGNFPHAPLPPASRWPMMPAASGEAAMAAREDM
jgi:hypothetical protein